MSKQVSHEGRPACSGHTQTGVEEGARVHGAVAGRPDGSRSLASSGLKSLVDAGWQMWSPMRQRGCRVVAGVQ